MSGYPSNPLGQTVWFIEVSRSRKKSWPVRTLAREGQHDGVETKALWKSTPFAATRSKFGVRMNLQP